MSNQETNTQVAAEKAEVVKDTQNGVTRPGPDTSTGRVWAICDIILASATEENPITRARVIKTAEAEGINVSTAATQYGRYRKYMGLEKEVSKAVKPATEKAPKKTKKVKDTAEAAAPVVEEVSPVEEVQTSPLADALGEDEAQA